MCPRFGNMLLLLSCTLPSAIMWFFNTFCEGAWRFLNNALKFIYNTIAFAQQNIPQRTWKYWKHCLYENRNRRRPHAHVCNPIKKPKKHREIKTSLVIVRMNFCLICPWWVDLLGTIRLIRDWYEPLVGRAARHMCPLFFLCPLVSPILHHVDRCFDPRAIVDIEETFTPRINYLKQ